MNMGQVTKVQLSCYLVLLSNDNYIPLVMQITWLNFGGIILLETFLLSIFFSPSEAKHSIGHILVVVGLIDVKQKGGLSVGYWVNYVTLTFDLTHDLDLEIFKVNFCLTLTLNPMAVFQELLVFL